MAAKIKIRIDENGDTHFDVAGVEGPSCEALTEALTRAMGEVEETRQKEEYILENPDLVKVEY